MSDIPYVVFIDKSLKDNPNIKLEDIEWFNARGMERLHASGHLIHGENGRYCQYLVDIWSTKDGRILVKFSSRHADLDNYAYELKGLKRNNLPRDAKDIETWIPKCVVDGFWNWVDMADDNAF